MNDDFVPDDRQLTHRNRMWTPWRMDYVAGEGREDGCVFCNRFHGADDRAALVLHRGGACFVIMNLYPYAIGHLMIVPNDHVPGPEQASPEALREMAELLPFCLGAARSALACAGFNVGMNIGGVAGAGVADHMHEHIVPRWPGDANFMPILAATMVMPELPPVTYAKLRAEFERSRRLPVRLVVIDQTARNVLVVNASGNPSLPNALGNEKTPIWRTAIDTAADLGVRAKVVDWAGSEMVGTDQPGALLMQADAGPLPKDAIWTPIDAIASIGLDDVDATIVCRLAIPALLEDTE